MGTGVGARAQGQGHRGKGTGAREHGHWQGDDKRAWHGLRLGLGWDRHRERAQGGLETWEEKGEFFDFTILYH